jgi:hypothetical protein
MATIQLTLEQLRNAILQLPDAQCRELLDEIARVHSTDAERAAAPKPHSFLDIPPVRLGAVLRPLTSDDDLLGEMLEDRALSMDSIPGADRGNRHVLGARD